MIETTRMIEDERYKRQMLLWGEDGQKKLANARVAVVGLSAQGVYTALCLTSLGVGRVVLVDGEDVEEGEMFLDMEVPRGARASCYPDLLQRINSQVHIEGYPTCLNAKVDQLTLEGTTAIVDATNSIRSKQLAIGFGNEKGIPVLSTSSRKGYTKLMLSNDFGPDLDPAGLMGAFEGLPQDPLMALAMCGVTTEEVKKVIFQELDQILREPVRYQLGEGYRFGFPQNGEESPIPDEKVYAGLNIALFGGGGGLGNWGSIVAAQMGFGRVDIFDYDVFDSTNINRQVLAYDGIDQLKATHVAEKIVKMSKGRTQSTGHNKMILPGFETEGDYDLVFDFVDNIYTRALNSAYGVTQNVPLISAGALPKNARWDTHVADQTQCMDCLFDIYEKGRQEEMIRRASCAANPDPSVVMTNAIAAVLAMLESYSVFEPNKFGQPFNGEQTYRASGQKRFGTSPLAKPCECYSKSPPSLEISQADVDAFVEAHPHLLRTEV